MVCYNLQYVLVLLQEIFFFVFNILKRSQSAENTTEAHMREDEGQRQVQLHIHLIHMHKQNPSIFAGWRGWVRFDYILTTA